MGEPHLQATFSAPLSLQDASSLATQAGSQSQNPDLQRGCASCCYCRANTASTNPHMPRKGHQTANNTTVFNHRWTAASSWLCVWLRLLRYRLA
jgi:hypothetical protein